MKKVLLFGSLLFTISSILGAELIGHWKINDGNGTNIRDFSGGQHDGQLILPEKSRWSPGPEGKALYFENKINEPACAYIKIASPDNFRIENGFTVMVKIKTPKDINRRGRQYEIFNFANGYSRPQGFRLFVAWSSIWLHLGDGKTVARVESRPSSIRIQPDTWYTIAATFHNGNARLYINGKREAEKDGIIVSPPSRGYFLIGAGGMKHYGFEGIISDLRLYNQELNENEIAKNCLNE